VISLFLNCAQVWTRVIRLFHRISGRPQVTLSRDPVRVSGSTK
jgi:hypothetical protein